MYIYIQPFLTPEESSNEDKIYILLQKQENEDNVLVRGTANTEQSGRGEKQHKGLNRVKSQTLP